MWWLELVECYHSQIKLYKLITFNSYNLVNRSRKTSLLIHLTSKEQKLDTQKGVVHLYQIIIFLHVSVRVRMII